MNLQDLGATEMIAISIAALAIIGFVKGLIKTLLALICLGVSGYAALWGNEHAHDFTASWSAVPSLWAPKIVAALAGLIAFFVFRYFLNYLVDPFNDSKAGQRFGFGLPAAALSLCAGLALIWASFTGIRYAASLAELRDTQQMLVLKQDNLSAAPSNYLLLRAQRIIDESKVGAWQRGTDPFFQKDKLALSKLLVMYHHEGSRKKMLKNPEISPFINDPDFLKLAYSEEIKDYAEARIPRKIFNAHALQQATSNPQFMSSFHKLDFELLKSIDAK